MSQDVDECGNPTVLYINNGGPKRLKCAEVSYKIHYFN